MSEPGGELLTIAQAAAQMGVTEQKLRRLLARPEHSGRTITATRRTQTGTRQARMLPEGLLQELRVLLESEKNAPDANTTATHRKGTERADERLQERSEDVQLSPLAAMLIREKDARISEQATRIERLEAALQLAQENLSREQTLRMLSAPAELTAHEPDSDRTQNQPPNAPEAPSAATEPAPLLSPPGVSSATMETRRVFDAGKPRRAWWQRIFGRGEGT